MEEKITENTEEKQRPPHLFKKGESGNPYGRPKGSLNFATKFRKFIEKVAEQENTSPQEIEDNLFKVAMQQAQKGDYSFYRDIFDRVYGKPIQPTEDLTPDKVEKIELEIIKSKKESNEAKNEDNRADGEEPKLKGEGNN